MLFFSFFKTLVGKEVAVEMKNGIVLTGTLVSVDQYLNVKLSSVNVVDTDRYPQLVCTWRFNHVPSHHCLFTSFSKSCVRPRWRIALCVVPSFGERAFTRLVTVEVPDRGQCTHITTISHNYSATFRYLLLRLTQSCFKMLLGRRTANDNYRSVKFDCRDRCPQPLSSFWSPYFGYLSKLHPPRHNLKNFRRQSAALLPFRW